VGIKTCVFGRLKLPFSGFGYIRPKAAGNGDYFRTGVISIGKDTRKRSNRIVFYLDDNETGLVAEKMELAGIRNREAYIRKMILDGYVVRVDLSDVRKMVSLLSNATNNLNQIAKRANETRSVYESDIRDIQANYERLWEQTEAILQGLAKIQR